MNKPSESPTGNPLGTVCRKCGKIYDLSTKHVCKPPEVSTELDRRKPDKFHYALLQATLYMSQVPCDASYDKEMARLLGEVKKAHDEALVFSEPARRVQLQSELKEIVAELPELKDMSAIENANDDTLNYNVGFNDAINQSTEVLTKYLREGK